MFIIGVMIQLNNKHFRHAGGYSQGLRIPSVSSAPGESLKDDTMNNYKTCYRVQLGDKYLGQRNSFKDAISLAVGGQS